MGVTRTGRRALGGIAPQPVQPRNPAQWASPRSPVAPGASAGTVDRVNPPAISLPAIVPQPPQPATAPSGAVYYRRAPWLEMPDDGEPMDPINYVALAALGGAVTTTVVLAFPVPAGRDGVMELFGNAVFGAGWVEGSAALIWQILRNGQPERNYDNIRSSLGNPSNPTKLGVRIFEGDLIQVVALNAAAPDGIPGSPVVGARVHGWFYPKAHDTSTGW